MKTLSAFFALALCFLLATPAEAQYGFFRQRQRASFSGYGTSALSVRQRVRVRQPLLQLNLPARQEVVVQEIVQPQKQQVILQERVCVHPAQSLRVQKSTHSSMTDEVAALRREIAELKLRLPETLPQRKPD